MKLKLTAAQAAARDRLAAEPARADLALPVTLTAYRCGKQGCRCHADPSATHGPYAGDPQDGRQDGDPPTVQRGPL